MKAQQRTPFRWLLAVVGLLVVVALSGVAVCANRRGAGERKQIQTAEKKVVRRGKIVPRQERQPKVHVRPDPAVKRPKPDVKIELDADEELSPVEQALADRIERALDDEDFKAALACVPDAQACSSAEVRKSMVEALGWFGKKALPELTPFLADADEDVRESAFDEWSVALADIDDDGERLKIASQALTVLTDEDQLDEISGEYIGVDEKLAVESLLSVIEGQGSAQGVAKAKETYEFVTGEEFKDRAAAEKWIAEEYHPDEEPGT